MGANVDVNATANANANVSVNAKAANESINANANAMELTKDVDVPSQIGSKKDTTPTRAPFSIRIRIPHAAYHLSFGLWSPYREEPV